MFQHAGLQLHSYRLTTNKNDFLFYEASSVTPCFFNMESGVLSLRMLPAFIAFTGYTMKKALSECPRIMGLKEVGHEFELREDLPDFRPKGNPGTGSLSGFIKKNVIELHIHLIDASAIR